MDILLLKIMLSALVICLASIGIIKFFDFEELPYWIASTTVFAFIASGAIFPISLIALIWASPLTRFAIGCSF